MWHWFNCYLSGRHEYGVSCEPGSIFLRCVHCGKRSSGWAIDAPAPVHVTPKPASSVAPPSPKPRVLPFDRVVAR